MDNSPPPLKEFVDDAGALVVGGTPTSLLGRLYQRWWEQKQQEVWNELLSALERGEVDEQRLRTHPDFPTILVKYVAAARDGAARRNLRVMSEAIANMAHRHVLSADEFSKYADLLSRMTRDQMFVAGRLATLLIEYVGHADLNGVDMTKEDHRRREDNRDKAAEALYDELVPKEFATSNDLAGVLHQLVGHGLCFYADRRHYPTPILIELHALADLAKAAKRPT
ncbi:hypothetical protein NUH88_11760 [Nisaea acidiphila]|uniref:Uncharacterized protein n=1 Tax=Nisaea acidiphila TaxID=1862145 RepID=A0A9J7AP24_9PROT|nr:hypothetical protein [Nisaea acidiphila]UUX48092.1 hypothetical protein NUH88_11760 [Nisaea acidiphila]